MPSVAALCLAFDIGSNALRPPIRLGRVYWLPRIRRFGCAAVAVTAVAVSLLGPESLAHASAPGEYEVKAVFLFNFSQFVSWPSSAFESPTAPLVIGVIGHDPFGGVLETTVTGERTGAHPLVIRRYREVGELEACHILFISRSEISRLGPILKAVRGKNTLTVSDAERAAQQGVMVDLVSDGHRIRLQINRAAAEASGLTISSKLLRPSEIVATHAN